MNPEQTLLISLIVGLLLCLYIKYRLDERRPGPAQAVHKYIASIQDFLAENAEKIRTPVLPGTRVKDLIEEVWPGRDITGWTIRLNDEQPHPCDVLYRGDLLRVYPSGPSRAETRYFRIEYIGDEPGQHPAYEGENKESPGAPVGFL